MQSKTNKKVYMINTCAVKLFFLSCTKTFMFSSTIRTHTRYAETVVKQNINKC